MVNRMELSIVVPVYNAERYLRKCINSLLSQNLSQEKYEIIIVNDGSVDGSPSIAQEYEERFPFLKVLSQQNQGLSMARNNGLGIASGRYVWFVDADDWIRENCLEEIVKECSSNNLDMYSFCAADVIDGLERRRYRYEEELGVFAGKEMIRIATYPPCAPFTVYKRDFLIENELRFYPGIFHEDSEFQPRAYYLAERVMLSNDINYYVYHSENSIGRSFNPKKAYDQITVMKNLDEFCVANDIKEKGFYYRIGLVLNNSLKEALSFDKTTCRRFEEAIFENRGLLRYLWKSGITKYRLEYVLFSLFPKQYVEVYKVLKRI